MALSSLGRVTSNPHLDDLDDLDDPRIVVKETPSWPRWSGGRSCTGDYPWSMVQRAIAKCPVLFSWAFMLPLTVMWQ